MGRRMSKSHFCADCGHNQSAHLADAGHLCFVYGCLCGGYVRPKEQASLLAEAKRLAAQMLEEARR